MIEIVAEVTLFGSSRGGLDSPVQNGLRPSFSYAGELVACEVWAEHAEGLVALDQAFRARIKIPYGNELGWKFVGGESFKLNLASQVIGEGCIIAAK
jgi:hypothetical protein